jgi:hypothetical protein
MRGYFGLGQLSASEKSDILDQHKSLYNGYQTMQPQVSNTQPLTVYDFAGDKEGLVVNNKGEVKKYTNMGINEQSNITPKKSVEIKKIIGILSSLGFKNSPYSGYKLHMDRPNNGAVKDKNGNYIASYEAYIPLKQDSGFGYTDGKTPQLWVNKISGLKPGKDEPNTI